MKEIKRKLSLVLILVLFVIFFDVCFFGDTVISKGLVLSKEHIAYVALLTLITSFKYLGIKEIINSKSEKKFRNLLLLNGLFYLGLIIIYRIVPLFCKIEDWSICESDNIWYDFLCFIFLPNYIESLDIIKMLTLDMLFTMIIIFFVQVVENKKVGNLAYISERIVKNLTRYSFVFVFFICLFTIPNKFLLVRNYQIFGMTLLSVVSVLFVMKYYLALKGCIRKNKENYGKENLIILITPNNYDFSLSDHILNPLRIFNKFDNKNLVKTLLVDGKDYTFISYDAVRYELIDISQYKKIAYYIVLQGKWEELTDENSNFVFKVKDLIKDNDNFIMYHPKLVNWVFVSKTASEFKKKYQYRYTTKKDIKKILDLVTLEKSVDKFKDNIKRTLDYIRFKELENYLDNNKDELENKELYTRYITEVLNGEDEEKKAEKVYEKISEEKNRYLKYGLNVCLESFNYVECFYTLLKMSEYITHYMALKNIIDKPENVSKDRVREGTLSAWRECIAINPKYTRKDEVKEDSLVTSNDLIDSLIKINEEIKIIENKDDKFTIREKEEYLFKEDVCKCIADIRNKIVAHGVVTREVAEKLLEYLFDITYVLIKEFEELNISIKDDEKIKHIFETEVLALYKKEDELFLYSNTVVKKEGKKKIDLYKECLNYETGDHQIIDKKLYLQKDYIYSVEAIETMLSKWVERD